MLCLGPIAESLWGTAHLLKGTTVSFYSISAVQSTLFNSAEASLLFCSLVPVCKSITETSWSMLLISLIVCQFDEIYHLGICDVFRCNISMLMCTDDLFTGSSPDMAKQQEEAIKLERYRTTVPLLLTGKERRPLSHLTAGVILTMPLTTASLMLIGRLRRQLSGYQVASKTSAKLWWFCLK